MIRNQRKHKKSLLRVKNMKNELKWLGTAGKRSEAVRNHSKLPVKKLKPMILIHFY
jgi:hypothetical protein